MRWWTSWRTAEPVVKSVTRENGAQGVGTALLGLHALGADVLVGLSRRTCVDPELVAESLAGVDVSPVAKAWSAAVMPGTDYGWLRVGPIKRDADSAAVRVVSSLVAKGVSWPLALERAAASYGLPERDALAFAQRVSAPVVNPLVLADEADERLALHAVQVCKAESDAPVEFSKEDDWVEIKRGNRVYRQQVSRDDDGQFASSASQAEPEVVSEEAQRKQRLKDLGRQRRAKSRELSLRMLQQRNEQEKASQARKARMAQQAQQRRRGEAAEAVAAESFSQRPRAPKASEQQVAQAKQQVVRQFIDEKVRIAAAANALAQTRDKVVARAKQKQYSEQYSEQGMAWENAAQRNWPVISDKRTWFNLKDRIRKDLSERPNVYYPDTLSGTFVARNGTEFAPFISLNKDGLRVLWRTLNEQSNSYADIASLHAAEEAAGKKLFATRMLPVSGTPLIEFPMTKEDELLVNIRLNAAMSKHGDTSIAETLDDPNASPWVSDIDWHLYREYEPFELQRIYLAGPAFNASSQLMVDVEYWFHALNYFEVDDAIEEIAGYSKTTMRRMAEAVSAARVAYEQGWDSGVATSATAFDLTDNEVDWLVEKGVVDAERIEGDYKLLYRDESNPYTMLLHSMMMKIAPQQDALEVEPTPKHHVEELADWAGVPESLVSQNMPEKVHSGVADDEFPVTYSGGPPWI